MARLYASIYGQAKSQATRRGANTIGGHIRGWEGGVEVSGFAEGDKGDTFEVFVTGGSNNRLPRKLLATVAVSKQGEITVTLNKEAEGIHGVGAEGVRACRE